ncbi:hypothetical protein Xets_03926 [Xenorhabdus sp. TS4]|nr:hypothetical protein [Xenorhabdus sp. TS4]
MYILCYDRVVKPKAVKASLTQWGFLLSTRRKSNSCKKCSSSKSRKNLEYSEEYFNGVAFLYFSQSKRPLNGVVGLWNELFWSTVV